jgi:hypothetical protein
VLYTVYWMCLLDVFIGCGWPTSVEEEEEEEEDLIVFKDTVEGPRSPAVKPGRITQA